MTEPEDKWYDVWVNGKLLAGKIKVKFTINLDLRAVVNRRLIADRLTEEFGEHPPRLSHPE